MLTGGLTLQFKGMKFSPAHFTIADICNLHLHPVIHKFPCLCLLCK